MKYILFLIYLSTSLFFSYNEEHGNKAQASEYHGEVTYKYFTNLKDLNNSGKQSGDGVYNESIIRSLKMTDNLEFILEFNAHQSSFQLKKVAIPPEEAFEHSMAVALAMQGRNAYYISSRDKERINQSTLESSKINVILPYELWDWNITENEKCVDGRRLVMAHTITTGTRADGTEFSTPITAWYAPDIPSSYGPLGYDGLPGLILELRFGEEERMGVTATQIDIIKTDANNKAPKIKRPKAVADLSEGDFQRRLLDIRRKRGQ